ncbi:MAG: hypothetical protein J5586_05250 [Clostridia bacterium]|nr:hypothetical protein [Clostridia bacterium]
MTAFVLKLIACLAMLVDHAALVFQPQLTAVSPWLYTGCRMFGRLAFPIFALGIAEGTTHTSKPGKYLLRMFVFALLAQLPFSMMLGTRSASFTVRLFGLTVPLYRSLSVMATLFLGLAACLSIHKGKHFWAAAAIIASYLIDRTIGMDYGLLGVLFILALYFARAGKGQRFVVVLLFAVCFYLEPVAAFVKQLFTDASQVKLTTALLYCASMAFSGVLMLFYNKQRGPSAKLFIYCFYPVHMLILWVFWALDRLM